MFIHEKINAISDSIEDNNPVKAMEIIDEHITEGKIMEGILEHLKPSIDKYIADLTKLKGALRGGNVSAGLKIPRIKNAFKEQIIRAKSDLARAFAETAQLLKEEKRAR